MLKLLKRLNQKFDDLLYRSIPRSSNPSDCFSFEDDADKADWYEDCQDQRRSIGSNSPILKIFLVFWVLGIFVVSSLMAWALLSGMCC